MTKKPLNLKRVKYKGSQFALYNMRQFGSLTRKSKDTLKRWMQQGIMPAPFFYQTVPCNIKRLQQDTLRKYYFTEQELTVFTYLLDKYDVYSNKPIPRAFIEELSAEWKSLHERFESGSPELGYAKFVWRFDSIAAATAVVKEALGLPTDAKARQYVEALQATYLRNLGRGV